MKRDFQPAVYIMASARNGTLYVVVTSDLVQRVWQHREGLGEGFTKRYGCKLLVWYELHAAMEYAITREKQIKGGSRKRKLALIEAFNPRWQDLFESICHYPRRHCERSEAIEGGTHDALDCFVAMLLAMTRLSCRRYKIYFDKSLSRASPASLSRT